ncbi:MAG: chemotaxis protein CheX [Marinicellaceae bacterium]
MKKEDLQIFIDGATHYFDQMSESPAQIQTPYLEEKSFSINHEYTGIIGVSGKKKGCVYFTAPESLLKHLLLVMGEYDSSKNALSDLVGEVANTISGNARQYFGSEFMISVPVVVNGKAESIRLPNTLRSYVIPVVWRKYEAALVISLE